MEKLTLKLLLWPQVVAVSTLLLATIDSTWVQTGITPEQNKKCYHCGIPANWLVAFFLALKYRRNVVIRDS